MTNVIPKLKVLTTEQKKKVHCDDVSVLDNTGVIVDDNQARSLFEKAIGKINKDQRIRIPKDLIQWAINAAPSEIKI